MEKCDLVMKESQKLEILRPLCKSRSKIHDLENFVQVQIQTLSPNVNSKPPLN